jgi:hypothetical protein
MIDRDQRKFIEGRLQNNTPSPYSLARERMPEPAAVKAARKVITAYERKRSVLASRFDERIGAERARVRKGRGPNIRFGTP